MGLDIYFYRKEKQSKAIDVGEAKQQIGDALPLALCFSCGYNISNAAGRRVVRAHIQTGGRLCQDFCITL